MDLLIYNRKKLRVIKGENVLINRNTPVGDDANFYEAKPYGGKREMCWQERLGWINNGSLEITDGIMSVDRERAITEGCKKYNIKIDLSHLFHNGSRYVRWNNRHDKPHYN